MLEVTGRNMEWLSATIPCPAASQRWLCCSSTSPPAILVGGTMASAQARGGRGGGGYRGGGRGGGRGFYRGGGRGFYGGRGYYGRGYGYYGAGPRCWWNVYGVRVCRWGYRLNRRYVAWIRGK